MALPLFAFVLEFAQGGGFLFAPADEPGLLELQVAELLFVDQMGLQLDEAAADSGVLLILELIGKFNATLGLDGHFERRNAPQAPGDIGERLDQFGLFQAYRLEFIFVGRDVALVFGNVIGRSAARRMERSVMGVLSRKRNGSQQAMGLLRACRSIARGRSKTNYGQFEIGVRRNGINEKKILGFL